MDEELNPQAPAAAEQPDPPAEQGQAGDYTAALRAGLQTEGGDKPLNPLEQLVVGGKPKPKQGMLKGALNDLTGQNSGLNQDKEILRSVARGVPKAFDALSDAGMALGAWIVRKTGFGEEFIGPGFNEWYDKTPGKQISDNNPVKLGDEAIEHVLGKQSDDGLAVFAEGATQFALGWAASSPLAVAGTAGKIVTALAAAGRGSVVAGTVFDPYEPQLAELAASMGPGVVKAWGELLSVKGDDTQLVARLKRGAADAPFGVGMEVLVAGARMLRGVRSGNTALAEQGAKVLEDVSNGRHAPAENPFILTDKGNGRHAIEPNPAHPSNAVPEVTGHQVVKEPGAAPQFIGIKPHGNGDQNVATYLLPNGDEATVLHSVDADGGLRIAFFGSTGGEKSVGNGAIRQLGRDLAERTGAKKVTGFLMKKGHEIEIDLTPKAKEAPSDLNVEHGSPDPNVTFDRAEGEAQLTSLNQAAHEQSLRNTDGLHPEQQAQLDEALERYSKATQESEVDGVLDEGLDVSASNTPEEALNTIDQIFERTRAQLRKTIAEQGKVPLAVTRRLGSKLVKQLRENNASPELNKALESIEGFHVKLDAARLYANGLGQKISFLSAQLDARPHDPVVIAQTVKALDQLLAIQKRFDIASTEGGRMLRILREDMPEGHAVPGSAEDPAVTQMLKDAPAETVAGKIEAKKAKKLKPEDGRQEPHKLKEPKNKDVGADGVEKIDEGPTLEANADKTPADAADGLKSDRNKKEVKTAAEDAALGSVAGMDVREIQDLARMVRVAKGNPTNLFAVARAAQIVHKTGRMDKAMEWFANFVLSNPKTQEVQLVSGVLTTFSEALSRSIGGVMTGNSALTREGLDIAVGNMAYLGDNIRAYAASLKAGRSIINPAPVTHSIGGKAGSVVRVPTRMIGANDEFIRVSNYRAMVRAKSLRLGREQGLTGAALESRVTRDLAAAFDPQTGIATVPEALKYAEVPTFSGPLGINTPGGRFHHYVSNSIEAKFVAPFVKASVNLFRYAWTSTPGLNRFNAQAAAVFEKGGEEAAALHGRSVIGGMVYGYAIYQAFAGNITGRGPSNPAQRKLWLENNDPYTLTIGGEKVSYRRADPYGLILGTVADIKTMIDEGFEGDAMEVASALVASLTSNLGSKSYMQGISTFFDAFVQGNKYTTKQYLSNFAASMTVPAFFNAFSTDDTMREVDGYVEAVMRKIPGFSETLDPQFNIYGEPILRAKGFFNRNWNPFTISDKKGDDEVSLALERLGKGFGMPEKKMADGHIDLTDRDAFDNGTGKSPYARWMELVAAPLHGRKNLRSELEDLIKQNRWERESDGTEERPGGKRWLRVAGMVNGAQDRALKELRHEYPLLDTEIRKQARLKGAAIKSGESGEARVLQRYK